MRVVVISDSHRRRDIIEKILYAQPTAESVIFLGDNAGDIEDFEFLFPKKRFYIVSGNCDYFSEYPSSDMAVIGGKKIFFTHGHTQGVKGGTGVLLKTAKQNGCDIALYGHTHIANILYEDGVYIVNPGSCACSRSGSNSYAVIDIEPNGIMPIIIEI